MLCFLNGDEKINIIMNTLAVVVVKPVGVDYFVPFLCFWQKGSKLSGPSSFGFVHLLFLSLGLDFCT